MVPLPNIHRANNSGQYFIICENVDNSSKKSKLPKDALGQYNYGYADPNSAKQEVKSADGVVRGSYSYVDANGIVQTVNYLGRSAIFDYSSF